MSEEAPKQDRPVNSERDRRIGNAIILLVFLVVVGLGLWLANALLEHRRIDDCLARGGRNCTTPAVPVR
jgi:hypothetical protein